MHPICLGVIGVGDISEVYLSTISRSPALKLKALATRRPDLIAEKARQLGVRACHVEQLLDDPEVELVVNLTPGVVHEELNEQILRAGKHLYCEKPFALDLDVAEKLAAIARERGLLIGSAPDTFFGSAHQAARRALDAGLIGEPVFGQSFVGLPGLELFHPNPAQFYESGGEAPYDSGPYYILQWIHLLGPVRRVHCASGRGQSERSILRGPEAGKRFAVSVDTTFCATLEFEKTSVQMTLSLDVAMPMLRPGELFGSGGFLTLANPIFFSGDAQLFQPLVGKSALGAKDEVLGKPNRLNHAGQPVGDYRGVGLVEMALAIRTGISHRTNEALIVHTVEVMQAIVRSAKEHAVVTLRTTCERPRPVDPVEDADLLAMMPSPFDFENRSDGDSAPLIRLEH